jgi:small GTP-binding protein
MNLWDTAGQEKYRALTQLYLREADAVILMYDTTYHDSLQGVKEWYADMKEKIDTEEVIVALLGNKVDDFENNQVKI